MRLLDNDDVRSVLDMRGTITALRRAYDDLRNGEATYVPRIDMFAPTGRPDDYYQWGSMAGASVSYGIAAVRVKSDVVSWQGGTAEKYCVRPGRYCGLILCFRVSDGAPLAIIQDGYLQHMRVGGAAGIGTGALAVLGSGGMAWTFVEAIAQVLGIHTVPHGAGVPMMEWKAGAIAAYVAGRPEDRRRIPAGRAPERGAWPTLLDLETGRAPGRRSDDDVTVFVTTGTQGLQFASVAGHVLERAEKARLGRRLPAEWFLQDIRD
jgi:ornithine cyclodeaminase/alanine dehydrogenase-like protein (mu-crystallin family)